MRPATVAECVRTDLSDGEIVVTTPDGVTGVILNAMGAAVLELSDGTRSDGDIVSFLCGQFSGADENAVSADVSALLARLLDAGIIEDVDACGADPSEP